jgi:nicotinic acid phosphoribosyltransferase|tara:strand:- start:3 stop:272 length:270 start_codon:yes stop_codon:yes gene_type:complete
MMFKIVKVLALTVAMAGMASVSAIAGAEKSPGGTMEHGSMMQNDMQEGEMAGMMKMMQQMAPMMEKCNKMMSAMSDHMKADNPSSDDKG